jgi:hypothetical protein
MRQPPPNNGAGNSLAHVNSTSRQHKTRKFDNEQIPWQSSKKGGPNAVHENGIDFDAIRAALPLVPFPEPDIPYQYYRCNKHFEKLTTWL